MQALHDNGFDGYIRPDHGRFIWERPDARAMVYTIAHSG